MSGGEDKEGEKLVEGEKAWRGGEMYRGQAPRQSQQESTASELGGAASIPDCWSCKAPFSSPFPISLSSRASNLLSG